MFARKNLKVFVCLLFVFVFGICTIAYSKLNVVKNENLLAEKTLSDIIPKNESIADVIERVSPGVVTVSVNAIVNSYNGVNQVKGIGTGFFISPTKILTNQHVVLNSSHVNIILHDGRKLNAKVLNTDVINDIALLEVISEDFKSDTVLTMGCSNTLRVGEWVIAIGSPLDLSFSGSATLGIISGVARKLETDYGLSTFIQTDAAINPGNSGGPLLNLKGEVVGINTAKIAVEGVESIGFAIPINIAKLKLEELSVPVITLGIAGVNISEQSSLKFGISTGVFVVEVERESLSHKLGIIPGDIIVEFNGQKITSIEEINNLKKTVNDKLSVSIIRNDKQVNLELKINE